MIDEAVQKRLEAYFETKVSVVHPSYLEIVDADNELLGTLEGKPGDYELRVEGEFVESIKL